MRTLFLLALFSLMVPFAQAQFSDWSDTDRIMPDALRNYPVGLTMYHSPNPNYPVLNDDKSPKATKYVWKHQTCVRAEVDDLTIIKAGSYIWFGIERGWEENVQLNKPNFIRSFECPKGQLKKGTTYCFEKNYRYGNRLYAGDVIWYILAKDANGKIYKGYRLLETEGAMEGASEEAAASPTPDQQVWKAVPQSSSLNWTGYGAVGDYALSGQIRLQKGEVTTTQEEAVSKGSFVIDMNTIQHSNAGLVKHLRNKDFFNTNKYPTATFALESIHEGVANGQLTLLGTSQPISFPAELLFDGAQLTVKGKATVDRTKFGMDYNSPTRFPDIGKKGIRDDMLLEFELLFERS